MEAATNKAVVESLFRSLATGDGRPFVEAMADDFSWTIIGSTPWSGTWHGKTAVVDELLAPLFAQFADRYVNTASAVIAEGDRVAVECRGQVTTRAGRPYCNSYCYECASKGAG